MPSSLYQSHPHGLFCPIRGFILRHSTMVTLGSVFFGGKGLLKLWVTNLSLDSLGNIYLSIIMYNHINTLLTHTPIVPYQSIHVGV